MNHFIRSIASKPAKSTPWIFPLTPGSFSIGFPRYTIVMLSRSFSSSASIAANRVYSFFTHLVSKYFLSEHTINRLGAVYSAYSISAS